MEGSTTALLVRHGQVRNPNHVVYGHLAGFDLDATGVLEAHATATYLQHEPISKIVSSPLIRAAHTATAIARRHGLDIEIDDRLIEWNVSPIWLGQGWDDIHRLAPGEVEAYLGHPVDLDFAFETLHDVVARTTAAVAEHTVVDGCVVYVSHQDPVSATALALVGDRLTSLLDAPPPHASVTRLLRDKESSWRFVDRWVPEPSSLSGFH